MTSYKIEKITQRYLWIQQQKKETLQRLKDIRKEEANLEKEIKDYLIEHEEEGIQVNNHTVIYSEALVRKSKVKLKDMESRIRTILEEEGLYDPEVLKRILRAKEGSIVPLTKIKVKVN